MYASVGWQSDPALYFYTDTAHVHAVTSVTGVGAFTYDANGNMTRRVENGTTYTQTFDVENRLTSVGVLTQTTQYRYDANGQMVLKIAPDGTVTVYLGLVEYELDELGGSVTETTSYYSVPGARIVRTAVDLSYVLTDHLGSSSVTLNASGGVVGELRYYAYGETRVSSGSTSTERNYTGQLRQNEIGLYYYNARWYMPYLNRWVQPDTIVPNPGNPQDLNRYAYVRGNPLKYTDPSGHDVMIVGGAGTDLWSNPLEFKDWIMAYKGWSHEEWDGYYASWMVTEDAGKAAIMADTGIHFFQWQSGQSHPVTAALMSELSSQMANMQDITLVGHSKGANVVMNYLAWQGRNADAVFVSQFISIKGPVGGAFHWFSGSREPGYPFTRRPECGSASCPYRGHRAIADSNVTLVNIYGSGDRISYDGYISGAINFMSNDNQPVYLPHETHHGVAPALAVQAFASVGAAGDHNAHGSFRAIP